MFKTTKSRLLAGASIAALAIAAAGMSFAQSDEQTDQQSTQAQEIRIGSYEHERAFQEFHETAKFREYAEGIEAEFMRAVEANDQQKVMMIQIEAQQRQQELMLSFENKVAEVMPDVARENNLNVVALEIVYYDPEIDPIDVTNAVIEKINEGADVADEGDDTGE